MVAAWTSPMAGRSVSTAARTMPLSSIGCERGPDAFRSSGALSSPGPEGAHDPPRSSRARAGRPEEGSASKTEAEGVMPASLSVAGRAR